MVRGSFRRSLPYAGSLALHAVLAAALIVLNVRLVSSAPASAVPMPPVIEGVLVDSRALLPPKPPPPTAQELAAAAEIVRRAEVAREEAIRKELVRKDFIRNESVRKEAARKEAARKEAARKEAARKEAERREVARLAREQRETELRRRREADLQRALAVEEQSEATMIERSRLTAEWVAAIQNRVQRAWIRPSSARAGLDCRVAVTQAPGGTVMRVEVRQCNGDEVTRQSIEAAVLRASPLPLPSDPTLFERQLELRFKPNE